MTTNAIIFTVLGPLMVPLWFLIWDSWSPHSSFSLPPIGALMLSTVLFYMFGAIPAYLTGSVSGALYVNLKFQKNWLVVFVSTTVTVIVGGVLSALLVYLLSQLLFSSKYDEQIMLASFAALMGACSSLFCSLLVGILFVKGRKADESHKKTSGAERA